MADEATTTATVGSLPTLPRWEGTARYAVLSCLGQGGMGVVYEVFDRQTQERIALKTLLHFDASNLYRFKQEFRTLVDVLHPNLVHLHELVADEDHTVLFTMELVEGDDFLGYVHKAGAPPVESGVRRARQTKQEREVALEPRAAGLGPSPANLDRLRPALCQLVEGVQALHAAGKLHRDLKPPNVRVTRDGRPVILDFGVATELRRPIQGDGGEEIVGSATYMAPEQAMGEITAASDWYSVGVMLYEALVGRPPFCGSAIEMLTLKSTVLPTPPSAHASGVPEDLNDLCMALLSPDAELRPTGLEILGRLGVTASDRAPAPHVEDRPEARRLVGRESHLLALKAALDSTREGRSIGLRVSGLAGLGKSAVVHHFLDELEQQGEVLVLRGRVYQRESMPYKAVDTIIDAVSRHMMDLQARDGTLALPKEIGALAHVFPVLRRVQSIDEAPQALAGDPHVVRQLAFGALRELFETLASRQQVVVFIDDVQWGDIDSAALLVELMRPGRALPLLLVTTHRTEETETSPFLADLRAHWPEDAEVRDLPVGPLEFDDSRRLAIVLLGSEDAATLRVAEEIARESDGSPFLLEELSRSASGYSRISPSHGVKAFTLEHVLGERVERLPDDARRLLEVIAVGGRPLPVASVAAAVNSEASATRLVAFLQARQFVRAGLRDGRDMVEVSHDRIRDTIVTHLSEETARGHHARLASILEATPDSDPEAIASHLLGAGDKERAAHYAERAGEQAVAKFAFAQAARLFRLTVETLDWAPAEARRLHQRAAQAAEWAGLAEIAARSYLAAAGSAPELERVDLERAAAAQLLAAGHLKEGDAVLRRVLDEVGRPVPTSVLVILFWVIVYRAAAPLAMRRRRDKPDALSFRDRVRLDALSSATRGLGVVDPISAWYVSTRYLLDALRSGVPAHIVHAASVEASTAASAGGPVGNRENRLFELARLTAEENKEVEGLALYHITYGISLYLHGQWKEAAARLDVACKRLEAVRRWNANANVYAVYALTNLGALREVGARTRKLLADAERRGDLYTAVNLRASHPLASVLARDDVAGARRSLTESLGTWTKGRYLVPQWQGMLWSAEVELYAGNGAAAWEGLARDALPLRKSSLLRVQLIRVFAQYVVGRAALASAPALPPRERRRRLNSARRAARRLERESVSWATALAAHVAAGVARQDGDAAAAERWLRRAVDRADAAAMPLHASAARYRLGQLLEDDAQKSEGLEALRECGVRVPERYSQMLLPGWE